MDNFFWIKLTPPQIYVTSFMNDPLPRHEGLVRPRILSFVFQLRVFLRPKTGSWSGRGQPQPEDHLELNAYKNRKPYCIFTALKRRLEKNRKWKTKVGDGIPNAFGIKMVALCLIFQWHLVFQLCSVLSKMAAILSNHHFVQISVIRFSNGRAIATAIMYYVL